MKKFVLAFAKGIVKYIFIIPAILTFLIVSVVGLIAQMGGDSRLIDGVYNAMSWFIDL